MTYPDHWNKLDHETPDEDLVELARLAKSASCVNCISGTIIVEVGSWVGGTAWAMTPYAHRVYCIDHWIGCPDGDQFGDRLGAIAKTANVFDTFCANTREQLFKKIIPLTGTSAQYAKIWPFPVSMVFLDGDHEKCAEDIRLWMPHVAPGGILCGHDLFMYDAVTAAVKELRKTHDVSFSGLVWSMVVKE